MRNENQRECRGVRQTWRRGSSNQRNPEPKRGKEKRVQNQQKEAENAAGCSGRKRKTKPCRGRRVWCSVNQRNEPERR